MTLFLKGFRLLGGQVIRRSNSQTMSHSAVQSQVLLTNDVVRKHLENPSDLIPLLEQGLSDFSSFAKGHSAGGLINPIRTTIAPAQNSFFMAMPVYYERCGVFTCKLLSYVTPPGNSNAVLNSVLVLFDSNSGRPLAFMEAEELTACRTAVVTYLSAKHLLKFLPEKVALVGTGAQAAAHVQVLANLLKPKDISVCGIDYSHAVEFCSRLQNDYHHKSVIITPAKSVKDACESAQFIITCTSSLTPVLPREAITESCGLISIVGAPTRNAQEAESSVLRDCSALYADSREAAGSESGDVINSGREIYAELGEIIAGTKQRYELTGNEEPKRSKFAVFKSQGLAVEDAITSRFVFDRYKL